jgi:hypothetical protein
MRRDPKPPGRCIFCDSTGVTKQHVFPDWLKKIIPRTEQRHTQSLSRWTIPARKVAVLFPDFKVRQGHPGTRTVRNVCRRCNNQWISHLENSVKPVLSRMICGETCILTADVQTQLAAWAALMSVVAEFTDLPTLSIPKTNREELRSSLRAPAQSWGVWVARCQGTEWTFRYRHHGFALVELPPGTVAPHGPLVPPPFGRAPACNTQSSTFGLGELLIHTRSSTVLDLADPFPDDSRSTVMQIWPYPRDSIWPPALALSDAHANELADALVDDLMSAAAV